MCCSYDGCYDWSNDASLFDDKLPAIHLEVDTTSDTPLLPVGERTCCTPTCALIISELIKLKLA